MRDGEARTYVTVTFALPDAAGRAVETCTIGTWSRPHSCPRPSGSASSRSSTPVRGLPGSVDEQHVVRSIIGIAEQFGLQTIAEGVEHARTVDLLTEMGTDYAQGFHLGIPGAGGSDAVANGDGRVALRRLAPQ